MEELAVVDSEQTINMKCVIQGPCLQHLKEINMVLNSMVQQLSQPLLEEVTGKLKDVENASKLQPKLTFLDIVENHLLLF